MCVLVHVHVHRGDKILRGCPINDPMFTKIGQFSAQLWTCSKSRS